MWFLFAAFAADFTEIQPGVSLEGRVGVSSLGVSFALPAGWSGTLPPGSELVAMAHASEPGVVLATADKATLEQVKDFLSQPVPVDGIVFSPTNAAIQDDRVVVEYAGQSLLGESGYVGRAEATRGDNGTSIAFLAVGSTDQRDQLDDRVDLFLDTVTFHDLPPPAPAATPSAAKPSGAWASRLSGKRLLYMKTENGFSQKKHLDLCADGTAWWNAQDNYLSGDFSGRAGGNDGGQWTTVGDQLTVSWADGSTSSWTLSQQGERFAMDGDVHWFVEGDARCR